MWLGFAAAFAAVVCIAPAEACTVSSLGTDLGTYSPSAVKAKAVPRAKTRAGLQCGFALLNVVSGDYVRATFNSANTFRLVRIGGGGSVGYKASADEAGTYVAAQGATIDYAQNNLLNLLGLLGNSNADLPIFIKTDEAVFPPVGVYKDKITISWSWNICQSLGLLGGCVLNAADKGTGTAVIDITLTVTPVNAVITTRSETTWDPVNSATNPKDLPGSRRAISVAFANPDIVPLDGSPINLVLSTPAGTFIALNGDGASTGSAIKLVDGTPASTMTSRYTTPDDTTDDVEFSNDGGKTWGYLPVVGDVASQGAVTNVRVKAQGTMAANSSFSVRVPYQVR